MGIKVDRRGEHVPPLGCPSLLLAALAGQCGLSTPDIGVEEWHRKGGMIRENSFLSSTIRCMITNLFIFLEPQDVEHVTRSVCILSTGH
jgi:hypothetical protein